MGGGQMYVRNKCKYMKEKNWDVDIITSQKGDIYISDLEQYDCVIPELGFDFFLFTKSKREKVLKKILKKFLLEKYDEIVIESTCMPESTWAEAVAERVGGRHLYFYLQEHNQIESKVEQAFLSFKYRRHELAGILDKSLYNMFQTFMPIKIENSYSLPAYCNNVVEDIDSPLLEQIKKYPCDYRIGCLSRIDKPFVLPALNDFIEYARLHPGKQFVLVLIGGAPDQSSDKLIHNMITGIKNINLIITGYIFPIPSKFLEAFDAFFSSAGSTWVCMRSGVPTISYDAYDYHPIGILGRTTKNALMRGATEPPLELTGLLEEILEEKKYPKEAPIFNLCKVDFTLHDKFLIEMSQDKEYFDFEKVQIDSTEKKLSLLLGLVGADNYFKLAELKRRFVQRYNKNKYKA